MISHCDAAILTGGESRRMGRDKSSLTLGGRTLVSRLVETLSTVFHQVGLYGEPRGEGVDRGRWPSNPVVPDNYPGQGPLAGLETALASMNSDWLFVTACDHPFLSARFVTGLSKFRDERIDAVVPITDSGPLPVLGFYHRRTLPIVRAHLEAGQRAARVLLLHLTVFEVGGPTLDSLCANDRSMQTVNTMADWEKNIGQAESD